MKQQQAKAGGGGSGSPSGSGAGAEGVKKPAAAKKSPAPEVDYSKLDATERKALADRKKESGNDFFKTGEYDTAIEHYSESISTDLWCAVMGVACIA